MRQEKSRKIKRKESKEKEETVHGASTIRGKAKTDLGNISFYLSFRAFQTNTKNDKPVRFNLFLT